MRFFSSQALVAIMASLLLTSIASAQEEEASWSDEDIPIVPQNFKITNLLRTLDLSKPFVREITSAAVMNIAEEDVDEYFFPLDQAYETNLAYISAENRKTKEVLEVTKDPDFYDAEFQYYKVKLSTPLPPNEKVQITIKATLTNMIRAFPTHVGQTERQQFVFFGNPYALTAYPANKQKTTVITPSSVLEVHEHPVEKDLVIKNNQVILGPYMDVNSLEHGIFEIQYQMTGAVPHVRHLRRDIEVSQWGSNLAVEEHYDFANIGAELKGHFSRVEYQRNPLTVREGNAVLGLQTRLPKLARDIYYRDEIGNISTSMISHQPDHILLSLKPRFPIFGGWITTYYIGYNAPLNEFLRRVAGTNKYVLKVPVVVPMKETSYDKVDINVVLPEGTKNVRVVMPFGVESIEHSTTKTYMDSTGRATVAIQALNVIEEHEQDMLIEYELPTSSYLIKPVAAATMLMILFTSSMILSRLDFKIGGSTLKK